MARAAGDASEDAAPSSLTLGGEGWSKARRPTQWLMSFWFRTLADAVLYGFQARQTSGGAGGGGFSAQPRALRATGWHSGLTYGGRVVFTLPALGLPRGKMVILFEGLVTKGPLFV